MMDRQHKQQPRLAIIGGGIMGVTLAYYLTRQGMTIDLYEGSPTVGGLAGPLSLADGTAVDRFYHAILSSDSHLAQLCIETTAYIDPRYVAGHHLVYLPKYTAPASEWQRKTDDEIRTIWLHHLRRMFPDFTESAIQEFQVHRERYVEPLHGLNEWHKIPPIKTPIDRLYLVTTAQIYPALTNGESVSRHAMQAAAMITQAFPSVVKTLVFA